MVLLPLLGIKQQRQEEDNSPRGLVEDNIQTKQQ